MDANRTKTIKPIFIKPGILGRGRGQGLRSIATHSRLGVSKTPNVDESIAVGSHKDKC